MNAARNLALAVAGLLAASSSAWAGPQILRTDRVEAFGTKTYDVYYSGDELAAVLLSGDGDTDLDLYVYDADGDLVASDTDITDDCVCLWAPRRTQRYTIRVVNRGLVFNRYTILFR